MEHIFVTTFIFKHSVMSTNSTMYSILRYMGGPSILHVLKTFVTLMHSMQCKGPYMYGIAVSIDASYSVTCFSVMGTDILFELISSIYEKYKPSDFLVNDLEDLNVDHLSFKPIPKSSLFLNVFPVAPQTTHQNK